MRKLAKAAGILLLILVLYVGWYCIAADYDYSALAGTYTFHGDDVVSKLYLKADGTFRQELLLSGKTQRAEGTWRRFGEGSVAFSGSFLRLPGQQSYTDIFGPEADAATASDFGGHFEKILTLYPELQLDAKPENLVLHKRLFR